MPDGIQGNAEPDSVARSVVDGRLAALPGSDRDVPAEPPLPPVKYDVRSPPPAQASTSPKTVGLWMSAPLLERWLGEHGHGDRIESMRSVVEAELSGG